MTEDVPSESDRRGHNQVFDPNSSVLHLRAFRLTQGMAEVAPEPQDNILTNISLNNRARDTNGELPWNEGHRIRDTGNRFLVDTETTGPEQGSSQEGRPLLSSTPGRESRAGAAENYLAGQNNPLRMDIYNLPENHKVRSRFAQSERRVQNQSTIYNISASQHI